jgi:hypothetical protein
MWQAKQSIHGFLAMCDKNHRACNFRRQPESIDEAEMTYVFAKKNVRREKERKQSNSRKEKTKPRRICQGGFLSCGAQEASHLHPRNKITRWHFRYFFKTKQKK